ncbi:bifunctional metallophosphatase/5'-nucleotidase [Escherichia albertii]|uniref:bifunctional metallophosphatase/5'-nucleotidase n=1 Tax=Escherichia albertii TaxID=208962 RepID=UPI000F6837DD|nr:bifunctional UDP-sugar hydrolase/5'-nucleotidase [Escherichia albertii]EFO1270373.1 bifunctional metallophosphatase/5'-nucleotidase [Escherichia albertii]MCZ8804615.1 bifunctional UDP-sugar hydrolase/5'-nucleotidase [Escherichia albertii]MCZ9059739.1 bifunctional UDP-sugar hydrolase/5'-nucleotidase [Escherichia albertii]
MKIKNIAAGILLTLPLWACAKEVTIIYTNDLHAHVDTYKLPYVADGKRAIGGFANITTLVKQGKAKNKATFYFDAGDYFTGPYISSLTKGQAIIDIMNTMPFDVVSIGNHEFDHGWDNLLRQLSKANFPVLLGNVFHKDSEIPFWNKPYTILEKDGVKIGVIGLHGVFAFNDTISELSIQGLDNDNNNRFDKSAASLKNQGIEARDEVKYLQHYLDELRGKVDITVALIHEGVPARQSSIGNTDVRRALDTDIQTASKVKGLDILITGHAHVGTPEPIKVGNTLILSTDSGGIDVGKLVLNVDPAAHTHKVKSFELKTLYADEWKPDPTTQKVIDGWNKKLADIVRQPVGESPVTLTRAYGESSQLGNLFTDAMLVAAPNAQIALINSGSLRADINAGPITFGDITSTFPFKNELTEMDLSGKDLRNLMEHGASLTNGILQMSKGAEMHYIPQKPVGQRIESFTINGKAVVDTETYHVATTTFLALGGDGFLAFKEGKNVQVRAGHNMSDVVIDYLKSGHKIVPAQINEMRVNASK